MTVAANPQIVLVWHQAALTGGTRGSPVPGTMPRRREWQVMNVGVSLEQRSADLGPPPGRDGQSTVHRADPDGFRVDITAPSWPEARDLVTPLLLGLVAFCRGMMYLNARVAEYPGSGGTGILILGAEHIVQPGAYSASPGPHVLVDVSDRPLRAHIIRAPFLGEDVEQRAQVVSLDALGVPTCDDEVAYLPPKAARSFLRARLGLQGMLLTESMTGRGGPSLLAALEQSADLRGQEVIATLVAWLIPSGALRDWIANRTAVDPGHAYLQAAAAYSDQQLDELRAMQRIAAGVYGRLEPERALSWTTEELGELAQTIRRREHSARIREEIGHVFSWILCLANICEVDLADAADLALRHEAMRQVSAYGALRPYRPTSGFRSPS